MIDRNLRIVFMGTPEFAVASLQILLEAGYTIAGVVTAPDKPGGRGMKQMISSPVKKFALDNGLPLLQPSNLKSPSFLEALRSLRADLQVVVAFRMLPEVVWSMPPKGTLNLHGSLLPALRGAAPIHWAVIRGHRITGVTTFLLQHEIDTGHILLQREIPILDEDTTGTLHDRMMHIGAGLVAATVDLITLGQISAVPQDETKASHAPKINHDDGHIHWSDSALNIYNLIRGMSPYPGAWTMLDGKLCKIWMARIHQMGPSEPPGSIRVENKKLLATTGEGILEILEIQPEGKKKMSVRDFLNGYQIKTWFLT